MSLCTLHHLISIDCELFVQRWCLSDGSSAHVEPEPCRDRCEPTFCATRISKIPPDVDKIGFRALLFRLCRIARGGKTVNWDPWEVVVRSCAKGTSV